MHAEAAIFNDCWARRLMLRCNVSAAALVRSSFAAFEIDSGVPCSLDLKLFVLRWGPSLIIYLFTGTGTDSPSAPPQDCKCCSCKGRYGTSRCAVELLPLFSAGSVPPLPHPSPPSNHPSFIEIFGSFHRHQLPAFSSRWLQASALDG